MILEKGITALNAVCPYFTMFPLDYPYGILSKYGKKGDLILDPFCGRGTTLFASRLLGMPCVGIDSSPVAAAIAEAKLANTTPEKILNSLKMILRSERKVKYIPKGEFWNRIYSKEVLYDICKIREALIEDCSSESRKALRAIFLGALHGPVGKTKYSYFSNQCPRTYAPKPKYALKFWKARNMKPPQVSILEIVEERARRYYSGNGVGISGKVIRGDSREEKTFKRVPAKVKLIITSPPYFGMSTYIPDQWLRLWFLGGDSSVTYSAPKQFSHGSESNFINQLKEVWKNVGNISTKQAKLFIRFGAINTNKVNPKRIIEESLMDTGWSVNSVTSAGTADRGRRQYEHFSNESNEALTEYDFIVDKKE